MFRTSHVNALLCAAGCCTMLFACGGDASTGDSATADASTDAAIDRPARSTVAMPDGEAGIGFDDLQYSAALDRILVPAGRAGYVGLLDPHTEEVQRLGELSTGDTYTGGHDFGTTSAIEAEGLVYAIDRTTMMLYQLDPQDGSELSAIALGSSPDYVRFVASTRELWVTQPGASRFEIFALDDASPPGISEAGTLTVNGGPESLVINAAGTVGYTNTFLGSTVRIDLATRELTDTWDNGCTISLGIALDEEGDGVFVGCTDGKATALDLADGALVSMLAAGAGVDIISFNPRLRHLYLNGSTHGQLTVADVSDAGELSELAVLDTAPSTNSSCVLGDPHGNVWVCNANAGELFRVTDTF